ncbi:MAG: UMP kinase [Clostridia bacterium]|nr:UMP kinase [Clostridia bacterium]
MTYIISVGGSLIVPAEGIDTKFLSDFSLFINKQVQQGNKFLIVAGGGVTARQYVKAANQVQKIPIEEQDWLGIHATRLNAHLLKTVLLDIAHPEIITNPEKNLISQSSVIIASGYRPGYSTDYVAVLLAKKYKTDIIINLSNIDQVYDQDPKKFSQAKKIKEISWTEFRKIIGYQWKPGLNTPFDPIASALAEKLKLKVVVINGKNIKNIENCLDGKKYIGSLICN